MLEETVTVKDFENIVTSLIKIAAKLKDVSMQEASYEVILPLQEEQEELIQKLLCAEKAFVKKNKKTIEESNKLAWTRVQKGIQMFQELNDTFVNNLMVRKELIHFDLNEIKKTRQSVAKLRGSYGKKRRKQKAGVSKNKHINTLT
jgi:hypothetical protein